MIGTQKLYQSIDTKRYDSFKASHLGKTLGWFYGYRSTQGKWLKLCQRLGEVLPLESRGILQAFCLSRLNSNPGVKLTLEDCVAYLEDAYFLLTNTDEAYVLNQGAKDDINTILLQAMTPEELCEPGRRGHFESIGFLYRQDLNWVTAVLAKFRYLVITQLAKDYHRISGLDEGYEIHVINFMLELAEKEHLGLRVECKLKDVYFKEEGKKNISDYFYQTFDAYLYQHYESHATVHLTQTLLDRLSLYLQKTLGRDLNRWEEGPLLISLEEIGTLQEWLCSYLNLPEELTCLNNLISTNYDDDGNESYKLLAKGQLSFQLKELLNEKLRLEGYVLPTFKPLSPEDVLTLRPKPGTQVKEYLRVAKAIQSFLVDKDAFQLHFILDQYHQAILAYPEILSSALSQAPELIYSLPQELRQNSRFLYKVFEHLFTYMAKVEDDIAKAEDEGHKAKKQALLLSLEYLFLANPLGSVEKISDQMKSNLALEKYFLTEGTWRARVYNNAGMDFLSMGTLEHFLAQREHCRKEFLSMEHLSLFDLKYGLAFFTPSEAQALAKEREAKGLAPLTDFLDLAQDLKPIEDAYFPIIRQRYPQGMIEGMPLTPDQEAFLFLNEVVRMGEKFFLEYAKNSQLTKGLREHSSWFLALYYYDQDRKKAFPHGFWQVLGLSLKNLFLASVFCAFSLVNALFTLFYALVVFLLQWAFLFPSLSLVPALILTSVLSLSLFFLACVFLNWALESKFPFIIEFFFVLVALTSFMMTPLAVMAFCLTYAIYPSFQTSIDYLTQALEPWVKLLSQGAAFLFPTQDARPLDLRVSASIWRLLHESKELSALHKGEVLNQLWAKIYDETLAGKDLEILLTKPYEFEYQGKLYCKSFLEVAEIRREAMQDFSLESPKASTGFFSFFKPQKTTTLKILDLQEKGLNESSPKKSDGDELKASVFGVGGACLRL